MLISSDPVVPLGAWWEEGIPQRHPAWSRPWLPWLELLYQVTHPRPPVGPSVYPPPQPKSLLDGASQTLS